jgi:hypothetical protein
MRCLRVAVLALPICSAIKGNSGIADQRGDPRRWFALGQKKIRRSSAHAEIIESEPVIHVLAPEAGEDLRGAVGARVESDSHLLVNWCGAEGILSDNVDASYVANAEIADVRSEVVLHPSGERVVGVRLHRDAWVVAFQLLVESRIQASLLPECEKLRLRSVQWASGPSVLHGLETVAVCCCSNPGSCTRFTDRLVAP